MAQAIAATIGTFDGVHLGHRALLQELQACANQQGLSPYIITFDPPPSIVLRPEAAPAQLSTALERVERLRSLGFENIILLPFTQAVADLTAQEFMLLLRDKYGVQSLLVGYDHRFGKGANLDLDTYRSIGETLGISVCRAQALQTLGEPISSSRIRQLLQSGKLEDANALLGYEYTLSGKVVGGLQIGRSLGYPTANISPDDPNKLIPSDGVYAVRIRLEPRLGTTDSLASYHTGMLYIGNRPTIDQGLSRTIEVNIFDLSANLYAQRLRLEFVQYIRPDKRFASLDDLQRQITQDEENIRHIFGLLPKP